MRLHVLQETLLYKPAKPGHSATYHSPCSTAPVGISSTTPSSPTHPTLGSLQRLRQLRDAMVTTSVVTYHHLLNHLAARVTPAPPPAMENHRRVDATPSRKTFKPGYRVNAPSRQRLHDLSNTLPACSLQFYIKVSCEFCLRFIKVCVCVCLSECVLMLCVF